MNSIEELERATSINIREQAHARYLRRIRNLMYENTYKDEILAYLRGDRIAVDGILYKLLKKEKQGVSYDFFEQIYSRAINFIENLPSPEKESFRDLFNRVWER